MSLTSTHAGFNYAALPLAIYRAGEDVLVNGSTTGRLLFLKQGGVAVTRQGTEIAIVDEPGAVFGEVSALLNRPHTADVCSLQPRSFMSLMQICLATTLPRFFMLLSSWHGVLTARTRH